MKQYEELINQCRLGNITEKELENRLKELNNGNKKYILAFGKMKGMKTA